jgi:hypothetical protein
MKKHSQHFNFIKDLGTVIKYYCELANKDNICYEWSVVLCIFEII